jgi:hypothetical protein
MQDIIEYKTSILIGCVYIIAFILLPFVRTVTFVTAIFFILHLAFHGLFVLMGRRGEKLHNIFVETHMATVSILCLYGASVWIYLYGINHIV